VGCDPSAAAFGSASDAAGAGGDLKGGSRRRVAADGGGSVGAIDDAARSRNGRPRQTLDWMSPSERLAEALR